MRLIPSMFILAACAPWIAGCQSEEVYREMPRAVYITQRAPDGTANITNSTSVRKTISDGAARVYLNQPSDTDVTVTFTVSGTAIPDVDYIVPSTQSAVVMAGRYSGEINFTVLNNPDLVTPRTVVITLTAASEGYGIGIGIHQNYDVFTYTITP